jgi:hypothetical protein
MPFRSRRGAIYQWKSRVMLKLLDETYWWNRGVHNFPPKTVTTFPRQNGDGLLITHLRDDVKMQVGTEFQSFSDGTPVASILDSVQSLTSKVGVGLGGLAKFSNIKAWKKTDPLKIALTMRFDTENSAKYDVYLPAMALLGYTIPEETPDGLLKTPGANLFDLIEKVKSSGAEGVEQLKGVADGNRTVSLLIGGWFYVSEAVLLKAEPTFSKNVTESGYPLWAEVNIELESLQTATIDNILAMVQNAQTNDLFTDKFKSVPDDSVQSKVQFF